MVVARWSSDFYSRVRPAESHTISGFHIDSHFRLYVIGEAVDVPQPVPELSVQVPEAILIVMPVAGEVGVAIGEPSLNDQPATTICTHVTVGQLTGVTEGIGGVAMAGHLIEASWSHPH